MFDSILVVCTGNICCSPMGERYLQSLLPNKKIDSAGTGALVGHEADPTASRIAQNYGISLSNHCAKQFTSTLGRKYDLILAMEKEHIEKISQIAPEVRGKTMLFGHWAEYKDIPDPYRKSEEVFTLIFELIKQSGDIWAKKLSV